MTDAPRATTFTCTLEDGAIPIAFDHRQVFGRARPPVVVELNGHHYRSTIAIMNGRVFVPLRRSNREAAGVAVGDTVEVALAIDIEPRTVAVPDDLAKALDEGHARTVWATLSYSRRRELVDAIEAAKRSETRRRRIDAAVASCRDRVV